MQSGKGGQLQGKGPTCRDESPKPEADSTEERMWRARRRVRAFKNMQKELMAICHFSFEGFRSKNVGSDTLLKHRVVSCGCPAPLRSIITARGAGSALGLLADPSTRQLSSSAFTAPAASRASTSSLGLTALAMDMHMAHLEYFPQLAAQENVFPRLFNSCQMTET